MFSNIGVYMNINSSHLPFEIKQPICIFFLNFRKILEKIYTFQNFNFNLDFQLLISTNLQGFGSLSANLIGTFSHQTQIHQIGIICIGFPIIQRVIEIISKSNAQFCKKKVIHFQSVLLKEPTETDLN